MADTFDRALATEEVKRVILAYPQAVDRGDLAAVAKIYDGVKMGNSLGQDAPEPDESTMESRTAAEAEAMYRQTVILYDDGLPHTKHVITNIDISFSEDKKTANSKAFYTVLQALPDFPLQIIIAGRYEDTFALENGLWRMKVRREYADLIGDLSRHVSPETVKHLKGEA